LPNGEKPKEIYMDKKLQKKVLEELKCNDKKVCMDTKGRIPA
jgi:hypothetical protein